MTERNLFLSFQCLFTRQLVKALYPGVAPRKVSVPPSLLAWLGFYGSSRLKIPAVPAHTALSPGGASL